MAKRGPQSFMKRQREMEKKRKAEEKRERRFHNKKVKAGAVDSAGSELEAPPPDGEARDS